MNVLKIRLLSSEYSVNSSSSRVAAAVVTAAAATPLIYVCFPKSCLCGLTAVCGHVQLTLYAMMLHSKYKSCSKQLLFSM
jgi:hypothetical protein